MTARARVEPARTGRPRSERSRRAILRAAEGLLEEVGLRAMTIEGVAARAGVSKATIYRWWPSKGVLALDAIHERWVGSRGLAPDTGSLREDLRVRLRATVRLFAGSSLGATLADLVGEAQTDLRLAEEYHERVLEPLRAQLRTILERAIARGEVASGTDVEAAIDLIQGPFYLRLLHTHAPLDRRFADVVAELATRGLAASRP